MRKDLLIAAGLGAVTAVTVAFISAHDPTRQSVLTDLSTPSTTQTTLAVAPSTDPIVVPDQAPAAAPTPSTSTPVLDEGQPASQQSTPQTPADEPQPVTVVSESLAYIPSAQYPGMEDGICTYQFSDGTSQNRWVGRREVPTAGKPKGELECSKW